MISSLVMLTNSMSSTAKAGYEMMDRSPASTSLEVEALGNRELRMDWKENTHPVILFDTSFIKNADDKCKMKLRSLASPQSYLTVLYIIW